MSEPDWLEKWLRQQCDICYRDTGSVVDEGGCATPDAEQTRCDNCRYNSQIRPDDHWRLLMGHELLIEYRDTRRPLCTGTKWARILHVFDDDMVYIDVDMFGLPKFTTITDGRTVRYDNWEFKVLLILPK